MGLIYSQNWDGVTAPAIPAGWTNEGDYGTNSADGVFVSSANALKIASGADRVMKYATLDGNSGNVAASVDCYFTGIKGTDAPLASVFCRRTDSNTAFANVTCYVALINMGSSLGFGLFRVNNGTNTQLGSFKGYANITMNTWYRITVKTNGSAISASLQRLSDGQYLQSSGSFSSTVADAISVTDGSPISGQGYSGIRSIVLAGSSTLYYDDFELDSFASMTASPASLTSGTVGNNVVLTGTNTNWTSGFPGAPTFTITKSPTNDASIASQNVGSASSANLTINAGATVGTITITDPVSGANVTLPVNGPTVAVAVNDANLYRSSQWRRSGTTFIETVHNGAYLKMAFSTLASGTLSLNIDVSPLTAASVALGSYPRIAWSIDNGAFQTHQLTSSDNALALASGLSAANHTLFLYVMGVNATLDRWNTPVGVVRVTGLTLSASGATLAPSLRPKRVDVIGDSITEGIFGIDTSSQINGTDAFKSYAFPLGFLGRNAEVNVWGWSGIGWAWAGQGNVPVFYDPVTPANSAFRYFGSGNTRTTAASGDVSSFTNIDEVFVNLGTNDAGNGVTDGAVTSSVTAWIVDARSRYGGSTRFYVCVPVGGQKRSAIAAGVTAAADPLTYLLDLGSDIQTGLTGSGAGAGCFSPDGTHPYYERHAQMAAGYARLADQAMAGAAIPPPVISRGNWLNIG